MMTQTDIKVRFFLDIEAADQIADLGISSALIGDSIEIVVSIPETIAESLSPDELIEFVGIDHEFLIHLIPED